MEKRLKYFNSWSRWRAVRNHCLLSTEVLTYTCTHRQCGRGHRTRTGLAKYKMQKTCTNQGMMGVPML